MDVPIFFGTDFRLSDFVVAFSGPNFAAAVEIAGYPVQFAVKGKWNRIHDCLDFPVFHQEW